MTRSPFLTLPATEATRSRVQRWAKHANAKLSVHCQFGNYEGSYYVPDTTREVEWSVEAQWTREDTTFVLEAGPAAVLIDAYVALEALIEATGEDIPE